MGSSVSLATEGRTGKNRLTKGRKDIVARGGPSGFVNGDQAERSRRIDATVIHLDTTCNNFVDVLPTVLDLTTVEKVKGHHGDPASGDIVDFDERRVAPCSMPSSGTVLDRFSPVRQLHEVELNYLIRFGHDDSC